jgi:hypothetical protein
MAPEPQRRSATKQETLDDAWCLLRVDKRQRHHAAQFTGLIMTYDLAVRFVDGSQCSPGRHLFARATAPGRRWRLRSMVGGLFANSPAVAYASASITRYIAGRFRFLTFT